jgi:hypothetical protein
MMSADTAVRRNPPSALIPSQLIPLVGRERKFTAGVRADRGPDAANYIAAASALGEIPLELWLIVMGLNAQKWFEQANARRVGAA